VARRRRSPRATDEQASVAELPPETEAMILAFSLLTSVARERLEALARTVLKTRS
jgi:hypothetical protein